MEGFAVGKLFLRPADTVGVTEELVDLLFCAFREPALLLPKSFCFKMLWSSVKAGPFSSLSFLVLAVMLA